MSKTTISERRAQYPLHERLIVYNSETMQRMLDNKSSVSSNEPITSPQTTRSFMVNGVNILNKNSLDSDTVMHRIIQRRQTHNKVERRRRDRMNNLFSQLSSSLPSIQHKNDNNRADILQEAIDYIRLIQQENNRLKQNNKSMLEEDDLASVTSCSSSNCSSVISSPPASDNLMFMPSSSTSTSTSLTLIHEMKMQQQQSAPLRRPPHHQYESVISFH